jgi:Protein of unknown function (DUF3800)
MEAQAPAKSSEGLCTDLLIGDALSFEHPTATVYLDESGVIKTDRFFGIGCLKVIDDARLTKELRRLRQVHRYYEEIHWASLGKALTRNGGAFPLATAAVDAFFGLEGASFCCMVADRQNGDVIGRHRTSWDAFQALSVQALDSVVDRTELVSVVADHADTPAHVHFEGAVKAGLNEERGRLAIATVSRAHSHAMDGLQLADLLLGASMFDFRRGADRGGRGAASQKAEISDYFLHRCGVASFRPAGRVVPGKVAVKMRRRQSTRRGRRGGDRSQ